MIATDIRAAATLPPLPARVLEREELLGLVDTVAATPALWKPHVPTTGPERHYACLHRDANVDVWAIFWMPDNDTGWHDHDISSGAVHVVRGALAEHALRIGGEHRHRIHGAGGSFSFGPSHIHRLTCSRPRSASIHAYSPPLWRLGQYAVSADGVLHRQSISYADELRPVELSSVA
jgi:hypothetical protein